jgi:hypothetical protein
MLARQYLGIEVDPYYAELQRRNIEFALSQVVDKVHGQVICSDARTEHGIHGAKLITFSPPYQDAIHDQGDEMGRIHRKIENGTATPALIRRFKNWENSNEHARAGLRPAGYSTDANNLGHLQGAKYWEAMRTVYIRSYEALLPGGYLVVVTKDQRDRKTGELVNLYGDTVRCCREIGFMLHQHIVAVLCKVDEETGAITPRTSHWQRMAVKKASEKGKVILLSQFEDVAVFRKA